MHKLWACPDVPSWNTMFMLEAMTFKIALVVDMSSETDMEVDTWTNVYHKNNPEGKWHPIPLNLVSTEQHDKCEIIAIFGNAVILTSDGTFEFTFRFRCKQNKSVHDPEPQPTMWSWAGGWNENGVIKVHPPSGDDWTKGPNYNLIIEPVHAGNFMAACIADQLGFDAVLNLADSLEMDLVASNFTSTIEYKKIPMRDGACNQIPDEKVAEAVSWLMERSQSCNKILVNCRAGIGRAGSIVVAFVFAKNLTMSYEEAYDFVFARRFVYPHRGLKDTLYKLYPRQPEFSNHQ